MPFPEQMSERNQIVKKNSRGVELAADIISFLIVVLTVFSVALSTSLSPIASVKNEIAASRSKVEPIQGSASFLSFFFVSDPDFDETTHQSSKKEGKKEGIIEKLISSKLESQDKREEEEGGLLDPFDILGRLFVDPDDTPSSAPSSIPSSSNAKEERYPFSLYDIFATDAALPIAKTSNHRVQQPQEMPSKEETKKAKEYVEQKPLSVGDMLSSFFASDPDVDDIDQPSKNTQPQNAIKGLFESILASGNNEADESVKPKEVVVETFVDTDQVQAKVTHKDSLQADAHTSSYASSTIFADDEEDDDESVMAEQGECQNTYKGLSKDAKRILFESIARSQKEGDSNKMKETGERILSLLRGAQ